MCQEDVTHVTKNGGQNKQETAKNLKTRKGRKNTAERVITSAIIIQ